MYPLDLVVLKQVLRNHTFLFFALLVMGVMFCAFGFMFLHIGEDLPMKIFGGGFALVGILVFLFSAVTNYNSVSHYYERGLLKKYGEEVIALITHKSQEDYAPKQDGDDDTPMTDADIERELKVKFSYNYQYVKFDGEADFGNQAVFDGLNVGDKIPIMILPLRPNINLPRMTKISNQVKRKGLQNSNAENKTQVSEALIDFDV